MVVLATKGQPIYSFDFNNIIGFWDREINIEKQKIVHEIPITRPIDLFPIEGINPPPPVSIIWKSGFWMGSRYLEIKDLEYIQGIITNFDYYQKELKLALRTLASDKGASNILITSGVLDKLTKYIENRDSSFSRNIKEHHITFNRRKENFPPILMNKEHNEISTLER